MNAPLRAKAVEAPDRDDTSMVSPRRLEEAVERLRTALAEIRATKTSIARSRACLPLCAAELELALLPPQLFAVEKVLARVARRLGSRLDVRLEAIRK